MVRDGEEGCPCQISSLDHRLRFDAGPRLEWQVWTIIQALRQRVGIVDSKTLSSGLGLGPPSGSGPVAAEEEIPAIGRERQPPEPVVIPPGLQSLHPAGFAAQEREERPLARLHPDEDTSTRLGMVDRPARRDVQVVAPLP